MNPEEWNEYRNIFERELKNILAFWLRYSVDEERGGFYGAVDLEGRPVAGVNKSAVLNTRILWTFAAAAKRSGDRRYEDMAERARNIVTEQFADREYGGYYMALTPDHRIADDKKHTYVQAFALYALCKYYEWKPDNGVMTLIRQQFALLEEKTRDPRHPGYLEAFTRAWEPIVENRMADHNEPRTMNTHLHMLEAYAALYKVWKDETVQEKLKELLLLFTDRIIRNDGHLGIFFDHDFTETEQSQGICSFGHDIEASWLLWEAAEVLEDPELLRRLRPLVVMMARAVDHAGVDKHGGLFLESYRYGSHIRTNKHWWLQAETLVGFMNAYQLTGEEHFLDTLKLNWHFIDRHVIDHEHGEWFTKVNRMGIPFREEPADDPSPYYRNDWKIDPWKAPYHNSRAMMEMISRIDTLNNIKQ